MSLNILRICRAVGSPSCKILNDLYHQQITEGNLIPNIDAAWEEIAYFQIGDNPGRKEPTTGEINYLNIFRHLHAKGYTGILGMEHGLPSLSVTSVAAEEEYVWFGTNKGLARYRKLDRTFRIYTADNGYYMGDRGFAGKWSHYEQSLRVPLIVFDPRLPKRLQRQRRQRRLSRPNTAAPPATLIPMPNIRSSTTGSSATARTTAVSSTTAAST